MSEIIENAKLDELTAEELDLVAGEESLTLTFAKIKYTYKEQSADGGPVRPSSSSSGCTQA
jgi:type VI protein secretion system component Hcp